MCEHVTEHLPLLGGNYQDLLRKILFNTSLKLSLPRRPLFSQQSQMLFITNDRFSYTGYYLLYSQRLWITNALQPWKID